MVNADYTRHPLYRETMAALNPTPQPSELVSIDQAAEGFGLSVRTIRRRIADGTIPAYRIGPRQVRIRTADLEAALKPIQPGSLQ